MQEINNLQKFYREAELRYQRRGMDYDIKVVRKMVDELAKDAEENYLKLSRPTICCLDTYIGYWVDEEIGKNMAKRSVGKPFRLDNPPLEYKATSDFLTSYPEEYFLELRKRRNEIWDQIDFSSIKNKWLAVVKEKNQFSLDRGFLSRIEMYFRTYVISTLVYKKFLKNVDTVIDCINQQIELDQIMFFEQESNNYCFICRMKSFPVMNITELFDIFVEKYPVLRKNKNKIKIIMAEQNPETRYVKETDNFEVILDKRLSERHQTMDLIHELGHVIDLMRIFNREYIHRGKYENERAAVEIEIEFMKKYFPELFLAKLGNILQTIQQVLFEIEIYQNPNKDSDKVYAECFNRCFVGAKQKINRGYLLNKDVVYNSFSNLPYTVAYVNVLAKVILKESR